MLPKGTMLQGGRYRIDFPMRGRGGFGITYHACHFRLEQVVVIKEFYPLQDPPTPRDEDYNVVVSATERASYKKAIDRFLREARILVTLQTDNVVRVYDCFEENNTAYIVMEKIDGRTLRDLLKERPEGHFTPEEVESIIDQMVNALEAIHFKGVFHLDISPDNVMQTKSGKIVLIDFGAARHSMRTNGSGGGGPQFKPDYAPIEVMAGTSVGPQSDLFELAMMAHELLTGNVPPSYAQREATGDEWQPQLADERWRKALARALQLKQNKRPSSVREWWNRYRHPGITFGDRREE
jgi:serine/threonine protein kinase